MCAPAGYAVNTLTLTKCPHCSHTVLSVASQCPACSGTLGPTFLGLEHEGELAQCRSCGHPVRSGSAVCPHCGMARPARRHLAARAALPVLAAVLLGALAIALRQQAVERPAPATAPVAGASAASPPTAAHRIQAAPPGSAQDDPVASGFEVVADAATGEAAAPPQTRWIADWSNVRKAPTNEAPIMRVLPPGTEVRATPGQWGWWSIRLGGDSVGYVAGALLRSSRPTRTR